MYVYSSCKVEPYDIGSFILSAACAIYAYVCNCSYECTYTQVLVLVYIVLANAHNCYKALCKMLTFFLRLHRSNVHAEWNYSCPAHSAQSKETPSSTDTRRGNLGSAGSELRLSTSWYIALMHCSCSMLRVYQQIVVCANQACAMSEMPLYTIPQSCMTWRFATQISGKVYAIFMDLPRGVRAGMSLIIAVTLITF